MSKRNRTTSHFKPRSNSSFSKTAYMYPNQRNLGSQFKKFGANNSTFFQERQRSLNNSVLDYKNSLNQTQANTRAFAEPQSVELSPHKSPQQIRPKQFQLPMTGRSHTPKKTGCVLDDEEFRQTKSKLFDVNFSHHNPETCVCTYCTCGRHLCKLHVIRPDMHNSSTYRGDYNNKKPIQNLRFQPRSNLKSNGPHVDLNSTYGKDFDGKNGSVERPKPEDCLNVGGPAANLTTYSSGFPGYRGDNQYIKPTNNAHINGELPFNGSSVYRNSYMPRMAVPGDLVKWTNHFKNGMPWLGSTTYRENYTEPLSDQYSSRVQVVKKLESDPNYSHQYQTTYKNDFLNKGKGVCPAKIEIESRRKGKFGQSKSNFNENADYKAMSPDFHAISTSGHSYV